MNLPANLQPKSILRRLRFLTLAVFATLVALAANTASARVVYLHGSPRPWSQNGNETSMDAVFGAGQWDDMDFSTTTAATLLTPSPTFIFIEGGEYTGFQMEAFLSTYATEITDWVNAGGRLILNAAPNDSTGFNMLFGVSQSRDPRSNATVVAPAHPIFAGPFGTVASSLFGSSFSHAFLNDPGLTLTILIVDDLGRTVLAEKDSGSGHVVFGGLTLPFFNYPDFWTQPDCTNLLKNLIANVAGPGYEKGPPYVIYAKGDAVPGVTDATFTAFGVPAVNKSGGVAVLGKWKSPTGSSAGILASGVVVAKVGDEVPAGSGVKLKAFKDPVIDEHGHVAFIATLTGVGITAVNDSAIVSNAPGGVLSIVAQEGTQAADAPVGALYKSFTSVAAPGGGGGVLFLAGMAQGTGGITATTDIGLWSADELGALHLALQEGTTVIGGKTVKSFAALKAVSGTPGQTHAFNGNRVGVVKVTFSDGAQAVVQLDFALGTNAILFQKGDAVPDGSGHLFTSFGVPSINGNSSVAFLGKWSGGAGIFVDGSLKVLQAVDGPVVSGVGTLIKSMKDPVLDDAASPNITIPATLMQDGLNTTATNDAVVLDIQDVGASNGAVTARVQEGTQVDGAPAGVLWKSFSSSAAGGVGEGFVLGFVTGAGITKTNDNILWTSKNTTGIGHILLQEGTTDIGGKIVKSFAVLKAVSKSPGQTHAFNGRGEVVAKVTFTDGAQAIVHIDTPVDPI